MPWGKKGSVCVAYKELVRKQLVVLSISWFTGKNVNKAWSRFSRRKFSDFSFSHVRNCFFFICDYKLILDRHNKMFHVWLLSQTMRISFQWQPMSSPTSWSKVTWKRNEKVRQQIDYQQSLFHLSRFLICLHTENWFPVNNFLFLLCFFVRPQLLWTRVAEEMVHPEQFDILLLWEWKRFVFKCHHVETSQLHNFKLDFIPLRVLLSPLQINSRRVHFISMTTLYRWWPTWEKTPKEKPVLSSVLPENGPSRSVLSLYYYY